MKSTTRPSRRSAPARRPLPFARNALRTVCALGLATLSQLSWAQDAKRDDFYWLGQINKASAVINTEQGLLDKAAAPRWTRWPSCATA